MVALSVLTTLLCVAAAESLARGSGLDASGGTKPGRRHLAADGDDHYYYAPKTKAASKKMSKSWWAVAWFLCQQGCHGTWPVTYLILDFILTTGKSAESEYDDYVYTHPEEGKPSMF